MVRNVHAERHDAFDRALDRVVDVEEFSVEEDLLALAGEPAGEIDAAGIDELEPDLEEGDAVAEAGDHRLGLPDGRHVEGDDQAVTRGNQSEHGAHCFGDRQGPAGSKG